jgi:signal transduction histidine kinase
LRSPSFSSFSTTDSHIDVPLSIVSYALVNLISNAKEALNEGGTIKIEAEDGGQIILCHVSDSGSGIPEEKLDKIFDLGYTSKPKAAGWGLYLVAHSLRANAGDILVSNISSIGTRFTLRLPKYQYEPRT